MIPAFKMIFTGLKAAKVKILFWAFIAILAFAITIAWQYRGELIASGEMSEKLSQLIQTNKDNQKAIELLQLQAEIDERIIKETRANQKQIRANSAQEIAALESQLHALRGKYEKINDFLSIRVPADYVRYRMLSEDAGAGNYLPDENSQD